MAGSKAKRAGPASKKGPPTKKEFTHDLKDVMTSLMNNQKAAYNSTESFTDVILFLQDGIIPVHGVLLEAVSEFFCKCFESQGPYYFGSREVFLPDFKMKTMLKVIQLLYNQTAFVQTESEAKEVLDAIKFLGIELDGGLSYTKVINAHCPEDMQSFTVTNFKSRDYLGKPMIKTEGKTVVTADGKKVELKDCSIPVSRLTASSSSSTVPPPAPKPVVAAVVPNVVPYRGRGISTVPRYKPNMIAESSDSGEESSTASELDEEAMKSPEWYMTKSKTCQKCKKDYETPGEASTCVTTHGRLRCYFCFRICKNTEMLFQHFARAHRKGGRENFVVCPCCEQSIAFKAVSCHVISMHLVQKSQQPQVRSNYRYRPIYKAPSTVVSPKTNDDSNPSKKAKIDEEEEELRVGNLDITLTTERPNGKVWVFNIKKKRV